MRDLEGHLAVELRVVRSVDGAERPGTELGAAPVSRVRVLLTSGVAKLPLGSASDFRVKDATGVTHDVTAGTYTHRARDSGESGAAVTDRGPERT